jgi:DNA primase
VKHETLPEGAVAAAMESLGIEVLTQNGDELVAHCPGHEARTGKVDSNPSWSINEETGIHFCFSCHYKGNLMTLVREMRGEAEADRFRIDLDTHKRVMMEDPDFTVVIDKPVAEEVRTANWHPESWLSEFVAPPKWALAARRISAESASKYEVLWDEFREAWILPLRDPHTDRLLGYQKKSQRTRLFRNRPQSILKSDTFFGWQAVRGKKVVVVVESPLDAVLLADMDVPAIAVCGSFLSEAQVDLLRGEDYDHVYLWLDNDKAGALETKRMKKTLIKNGVRAEFIDTESYPEFTGKDVGELADTDIEAVLDAAGI